MIAISAHATARDIAQAQAAGFDAYLAKPLTLRQLVDLIEDRLRRRKQSVAPA